MKADQIPVRRLLLPTIGVLACLTALTLAVTLGWGWVVLPFLAILAVTVAIGLANAFDTRWLESPTPPTNVRIETRDGIEIPVQCVYVGRFDGTHRWEVIRPLGVSSPFDVTQIHIGVLPDHTAIAMFRAEETEP